MKLKTSTSMAKRFKFTKRGKIMKKTSGQDHFNAREKGKVTRNKRRRVAISHTQQRVIRRSLPYN